MRELTSLAILLVVQVLIVHFIFPQIKGISTKKDWKDSAVIVIIFSVTNYLLRAIMVKFTFGLAAVVYYMTLGLIGLIINALILVGISSFLPEKLKLNGFWPAFFGGTLLALTTFIF